MNTAVWTRLNLVITFRLMNGEKQWKYHELPQFRWWWRLRWLQWLRPSQRGSRMVLMCRTFPPDIWLDITGNNTALGQLGRMNNMNNEGSLQRGRICDMILMAVCQSVFWWCPAAIDPNPSRRAILDVLDMLPETGLSTSHSRTIRNHLSIYLEKEPINRLYSIRILNTWTMDQIKLWYFYIFLAFFSGSATNSMHEHPTQNLVACQLSHVRFLMFPPHPVIL